jgi:hypothetical protein
MKQFLSLLAVCAVALAGDGSTAIEQARRQLDNVREQVAAGLLPASKLAEAQKAVDDAADETVLDRTLYGHIEIEDLTEAQAAEMLAAAERRLARTQAEIDRGRQLIAEGIAAPDYCTDMEAELARRQTALNQATERADLLTGIAAVAHAEIETSAIGIKGTQAGARLPEEFVDGSHGLLTSKDIKTLTLAFEKKFDKPLPVSARGETAVHRALGFDHTGRIDVALMPDSVEGVWLRRYLETNDIPYYAFRVAMPGKATGAHIHIGPGSTRLQSTD